MEIQREHFKAYAFIEFRRGKSATEIIQQLKESRLENVPADSTVFGWIKAMKDGSMTSLHDAPRPGRPSSSATTSNIGALEQLITENPKQSTRNLAEQLSLNKETVRTILQRNLSLRKVCSVWVPHVLTERNKEERMECAANIVSFFDNHSMPYILQHFAVEDESWVLFNTPRTKQENKAWLKPGEPRLRTPRPVMTPKKALLLMAFTGDGKIVVSAKPYGETVTAEVYIEFVRTVGDRWRTLRSKSTRLSELRWMHDNARPHSARETVDFFHGRGVQMIKQSPYSPDFNLCDRWVFKSLKQHFKDFDFSSSEEIEEAAVRWFRAIPQDRFVRELTHLYEHCKSVIDSGGDYVV